MRVSCAILPRWFWSPGSHVYFSFCFVLWFVHVLAVCSESRCISSCAHHVRSRAHENVGEHVLVCMGASKLVFCWRVLLVLFVGEVETILFELVLLHVNFHCIDHVRAMYLS